MFMIYMFDQVRNRKEFFTFCYIFIIKITYSRNYGANITFFELEHSGNQFFSCYPGPFKAQLDGIDEKYNENAEWGGVDVFGQKGPCKWFYQEVHLVLSRSDAVS